MTRAHWRVMAAGAGVAFVALLVLDAGLGTIALASTGQESDWTGAAEVLDQVGVPVGRVQATLVALDQVDPSASLVLVGGLGRSLTAAELDALARFVQRGGHAVVLADADAAARFGVEVTAARVLTTTDGGDGTVPARVSWAGERFSIRAAHVRVLLSDGERGRTVGWTANNTFVDADGDGRPAAGDAAGPFPFAVEAAGGRVLVLASPTVLSPAALGQDETRPFLEALALAHAGPEGLIVLDDGRASRFWAAPFAAAVATVASVPGRPVFALALAVAALLTLASLGVLMRSSLAGRPAMDGAGASLDEPVRPPRAGVGP